MNAKVDKGEEHNIEFLETRKDAAEPFQAVEIGAPLGSASCRVRDRSPRVRAGSIWVEPLESCSTPSTKLPGFIAFVGRSITRRNFDRQRT